MTGTSQQSLIERPLRGAHSARGPTGNARPGRGSGGTVTLEAVSFEPVYAAGCTLAPTASMARTMRFRQLGIAPRETAGWHYSGCELWQSSLLRGGACDPAAMEELWREVAAPGHEARKAAGGRASRPARLSQRSSIEESAAGRRERCGCGPDVAVHDAVSAYGRVRITRTGTWGVADGGGRAKPCATCRRGRD